jgi:hypothetical protein
MALYRLKEEQKHHVSSKDGIFSHRRGKGEKAVYVELSDAQYKAFKDKFEGPIDLKEAEKSAGTKIANPANQGQANQDPKSAAPAPNGQKT